MVDEPERTVEVDAGRRSGCVLHVDVQRDVERAQHLVRRRDRDGADLQRLEVLADDLPDALDGYALGPVQAAMQVDDGTVGLARPRGRVLGPLPRQRRDGLGEPELPQDGLGPVAVVRADEQVDVEVRPGVGIVGVEPPPDDRALEQDGLDADRLQCPHHLDRPAVDPEASADGAMSPRRLVRGGHTSAWSSAALKRSGDSTIG